MAERVITAGASGLLMCRACGMVARPALGGGAGSCPRCAAPLVLRRPKSLARTWALLLAAAILYIPANLLPIMETSSITGVRRDTIMTGIISLWSGGSWVIAAVVFIASITVPLLKFLAIGLLLVSIQWRPGWRPQELTRLYRLLEFVGRWSMLDVFVAAILTTVVQFKTLAMVRVGPAVLPFAAVVILTMLAAMEFDPRLIWDAVKKESHGDD